jgi:hypothetical protein
MGQPNGYVGRHHRASAPEEGKNDGDNGKK